MYDVISFKFHGRRYSAPFPADAHGHGCPKKIFQCGTKPTTPKKLTVFRCAEAANEKNSLLRHFRLHVRVFIASAEGASENVGYFAGGQLMTSSFSNNMGGGKCPLCPPLRVPMPMGACSLIRKFCFSQHLHPKFNFNKASP